MPNEDKDTIKKVIWVISWRYNDKVYHETYDSLIRAQLRMTQLELLKMSPTIHEKS